ncbi:hypothetical protein BH23THE1_BH23THE1_16580 [soil metagenome]
MKIKEHMKRKDRMELQYVALRLCNGIQNHPKA